LRAELSNFLIIAPREVGLCHKVNAADYERQQQEQEAFEQLRLKKSHLYHAPQWFELK